MNFFIVLIPLFISACSSLTFHKNMEYNYQLDQGHNGIYTLKIEPKKSSALGVTEVAELFQFNNCMKREGKVHNLLQSNYDKDKNTISLQFKCGLTNKYQRNTIVDIALSICLKKDMYNDTKLFCQETLPIAKKWKKAHK